MKKLTVNDKVFEVLQCTDRDSYIHIRSHINSDIIEYFQKLEFRNVCEIVIRFGNKEYDAIDFLLPSKHLPNTMTVYLR
jgi:hypothetical protein